MWLLFSGGGVVTSILVPILLFLFGLAFPLGWIDPPPYGHIHTVLSHWLTRLVLLGLCVLGFVHWAHRFRYTLHEGLKLQRLDAQISVVGYGLALVGSAWAAYILLFTG